MTNLPVGQSVPVNTPYPELEEATIEALQAQMQSGAETSHSLTQKYLARIAALDPHLNSVIEINPDARSIAAELDAERDRGTVRGPLHGIPVLIKDNMDTRDEMLSTAGSLALLEAPTPSRDAFSVTQLRAAGAVILGKTNLSEWANFRSTQSISGWSGRGGQTHNPYVLDQNPCGSSSGTGAAISANLAVVGVGTETNGSIICPSLKCGLVGLKPTLGLVSRSGIIPIAHTQDTAGPMTRTVRDAALLLSALVGHDPADSTTAHGHWQSDYTQFLDTGGLEGARLGIIRQFEEDAEPEDEATKGGPPEGNLFDAYCQVLREGGATLIEVSVSIPDTFWDDELEVLLTEFKHGLNAYLAQRGAACTTLEDLIRFNEEHQEREMPLFGQELFYQAQERGGLENSTYIEALQRIKTAAQERGIDALLAQHQLDVLVAPTVGAVWALAAVAGYPSITVPTDFVDGLPTGLLFLGRAFSEPQLLRYAYAFEQRTRKRQTPKFLSTLASSSTKTAQEMAPSDSSAVTDTCL